MSNAVLADDIALAHALADAAGAVIRPYFRARVAVETKPDASPVTLADRAAEAAMRELVEAARPDDGIIGEEYGPVRGGAQRQWVFDPIDGTRGFIAGRPLFGTLIALLDNGVPVLGIIDQCIARDRWVGAAGLATTLNGIAVQTRACATLDAAHLATTSPYLFDNVGRAGFERLRAATRDTLLGGDCHNYALLATGGLDLVVETGLKLYDWAALVPVVTGAGGMMCDWGGAPLNMASDGRVIAAGDAALIGQVLGLIG